MEILEYKQDKYSKMKKFILNLLNHNKFNKYVSFFLIAFVFWFLTMLSKKHEAVLVIPVSFINLNTEFILEKEKINEISVIVNASGFCLIAFYFFNYSDLILDASRANLKYIEDRKEIFWLINSKRKDLSDILGASMNIISVEPERISITINKNIK